MKAKEYYNSTRMVDTRNWTLDMAMNFAEEYYEERTKSLTIHSVVPMLPKIKSNEFESYLKSSGYERIDDELLQKGTDYYCVNNVYRHFLNLIEFGN